MNGFSPFKQLTSEAHSLWVWKGAYIYIPKTLFTLVSWWRERKDLLFFLSHRPHQVLKFYSFYNCRLLLYFLSTVACFNDLFTKITNVKKCMKNHDGKKEKKEEAILTIYWIRSDRFSSSSACASTSITKREKRSRWCRGFFIQKRNIRKPFFLEIKQMETKKKKTVYINSLWL